MQPSLIFCTNISLQEKADSEATAKKQADDKVADLRRQLAQAEVRA